MKVQSNLDLCNFELQNFCVQSYTNTNNVEPTLARMLFVNGNENSELANRLVIHNGTGWKGFAYLDDLTTFKDEDFNALKEKVELLSGDVDTDAIINNMKDVEAFLEGFTESQTLMDLLNAKANASDLANYLPLSGGTISGQLNVTNINGYTPITEGNIGDYKAGDSNKLNGLPASSYVRAYADVGANSNKGSWLGYTESHEGAAAGGVISFGTMNYGSQLNGEAHGKSLHYRGYTPNGWTDWKTIAFTDSDITGNAATATALKTPVSLWGNSFDGTQSLGGDISINNNSYLRAKDTSNNNLALIGMNGSNELSIGYDLINQEYGLVIDGYNTRFRVGSSRTTAMLINSSGNVTIGSSDFAGEDCKLYVNGGTLFTIGRVYTAPTRPSELIPSNLFSIAYSDTNRYGAHVWIETTGDVNLQSSRVDAVNDTAYSLNLNPLGGAVKVGSGGLNVTGDSILGKVMTHQIHPRVNESYSLGSAEKRWLALYCRAADFKSFVNVAGLATFNGGALIPSGQKLTIGNVTFEETENGVIKVDGNLYATGTLAAGGVAEEGESTGGSVNKVSEMIPVNTLTHTVYHGLNTEEVSVQIYERNDGGNWQMILTDVIIDDADNVTISFGAATDREHMCIIL